MKSRCVFTASNLYFLASTKLLQAPSGGRFGGRQKTSVGGKIMKKHITIGVAALAFGVALASVPASAQTHYGKALNDGGLVDDYNSNGTRANPTSLPGLRKRQLQKRRPRRFSGRPRRTMASP